MQDRIDIPDGLLDNAPEIHISRRAIIAGLASGTVFPFLSGCTTNPETGRSQFLLVGEGQIAGLSAAAWTDMKTQIPQTSDNRLRGRVLDNWNRIADGAGKGDEEWEVAVFDADTVNAFVMPGNKVGVFRGITELTENDDQLSSVLGHEVGHVTGRHAAERLSVSVASQTALQVGSIAIASQESLRGFGPSLGALGGAALQFGVVLPYSRNHETEADKLGVDYMHRAGYSVREAPRLWDLMAAQSEGQRPPELMSTHPDPLNRATELRRYINEKGYDVI
ncbi:MAG: M48 family metalloprotease [Hyphomonadaceae bacterium]